MDIRNKYRIALGHDKISENKRKELNGFVMLENKLSNLSTESTEK